MNRVNPLYIVGLFFVLVLISFILIQKQKNIYFENINNINDLEIKLKEYSNITKFWKNQSYIDKTVNEALNFSAFKNENIEKVVTKDSIKLKMDSLSEQNLDNFLNRFLNKQLIIKKLEVKQNSISLEVSR